MNSFYGGKKGFGIIFQPNVDAEDNFFHNEEEIIQAIEQKKLQYGEYVIISNPTEGNESKQGNIYKILTNNFVLIGNIIGPQGIQGVQGVQGVQGPPGTVDNIIQVDTSIIDGGTNNITIVLADGTSKTIQVKNGEQGPQGEPGQGFILNYSPPDTIPSTPLISQVTFDGITAINNIQINTNLITAVSKDVSIPDLTGTGGYTNLDAISYYDITRLKSKINDGENFLAVYQGGALPPLVACWGCTIHFGQLTLSPGHLYLVLPSGLIDIEEQKYWSNYYYLAYQYHTWSSHNYTSNFNPYAAGSFLIGRDDTPKSGWNNFMGGEYCSLDYNSAEGSTPMTINFDYSENGINWSNSTGRIIQTNREVDFPWYYHNHGKFNGFVSDLLGGGQLVVEITSPYPTL